MFDWLRSKQDTPESLATEVNAFFDNFRSLQGRINTLITETVESIGFETERHEDAVAEEITNHTNTMDELNTTSLNLQASLALATKVVAFSES